MFATFDNTYAPYYIIKLKGIIKNDDDFYNFTNYWINLNNKKESFIFIFDTTQVGLINLKYSFMMALFIKKLKKNNNYLLKSIIIINNNFVKSLLDLIFYIEKPIATVYLTKDTLESIIINIDEILNKKKFLKNDLISKINVLKIFNK